MGRELRRVPANWEHPKTTGYNYQKGIDEERDQPLYDKSYINAMTEWIKNHDLWLNGEHPDQLDKDYHTSKYKYYAEFEGNPPDVEYYRPDWNEKEMTCFQVYETVSEGTPVTPPFETQQELIDYLVKNGDFWDQKRRLEGNSIMNCNPWPREQAEKFVLDSGWAPSSVFVNGKVMSGVEALTELKDKS